MQKNILLGITSSIAAYKIYELIRLYKKKGFNVKTVITPNSKNFISPLVLETLTKEKCYFEEFAQRENTQHISLCDWADIFVVAPITANTISKFATGIADNLLTSVFCAYLGKNKPVILAPAMNDGMWNNPFIQENLSKLKSHNCTIIEPDVGYLACDSTGKGRLADINLIYDDTLRILFQNKENNSKKIVVTLGGTREKIDSVRFITNSSSGKMGTAICDWAYYLGYDVCAITTKELSNKPYKTINVESAQDMLEELKKTEFDYLIMSAAVGDFRAENISQTKISKEETGNYLDIKFIKNPDILKTISENKDKKGKLIGFCLTDKNLLECAKNKLENKNLDYIIANDVNTGLNTDTNKVTIISKSGKIIDIDLDTKSNIARKILEVVCD